MNALFIVGSPFQCLCAFEAIQEFSVSNPEFEIVSDNTKSRLAQTYKILDSKGYRYHTKCTHVGLLKRCLNHLEFLINYHIRTIILRHPKYDYLFVGDYRFGFSNALFHQYEIKKGGKVIYLDDGAGTISVIKGQYIPKNEELKERVRFRRCCENNNIQCDVFFTIFDQLRSNEFTLIRNDFGYLRKNLNQDARGVYFIGTNFDSYCRHSLIGIDLLKGQFRQICQDLQEHGFSEIHYIPHGRDTKHLFKTICYEASVHYMEVKTCVEDAFYSMGINPSLVIGYGSTALFTLKKMYPEALVINILNNAPNKEFYRKYQIIADEYTSEGIITISEVTELFRLINK